MMNNPYILIIEDEASFAEVVADILSQAAYNIENRSTGAAGLDCLRTNKPDLILLDYGLPDMTGLEVLRQIRLRSSVPVIFVSGRGNDRDKVTVLEQGADDYISKPFHRAELLARIAALLRRVGWNPPESRVIEAGALVIDMARRQVLVNNTAVHLTPIEFAILAELARHASTIVSHQDLLAAVWGPDNRGDLPTLRVNISRLRAKLQDVPNHATSIQTVPRRGYRIVDLPLPLQPDMGLE